MLLCFRLLHLLGHGVAAHMDDLAITLLVSWLERALQPAVPSQSGQKVSSLDELQDIDELCVVEVSGGSIEFAGLGLGHVVGYVGPLP